MSTQHIRRRRTSRGVAMVEAGILAPIFAMMMMLNFYLCGVYETKYRTVMGARYATFSFAANACNGGQINADMSNMPPAIQPFSGPASGQSDPNGANPPQEPTGQQTPNGQNISPPAPATGATHNLLMAHGTSGLQFNWGPTYRFNDAGFGPKRISTTGSVLCNTPPPAGGGIGGLIGYITGLIGEL